MTHIHTKSLWLLIATLLLSVFGARAQDSGSEAPWTVNPHDYKYDMTLYANIVFDGINQADGTQVTVDIFEAVVSADSAFDFLGNDFGNVSLKGKLKTPVGKTAPYTVTVQDPVV